MVFSWASVSLGVSGVLFELVFRKSADTIKNVSPFEIAPSHQEAGAGRSLPEPGSSGKKNSKV